MDAPSPAAAERLADFALGLAFDDLPEVTRRLAALLLLDTIGVAAAARPLAAGRIGRQVAAALYGAGLGAPSARLMFDGARLSPAGAAFAGATQIDNLDAHDGYNPTKGHIGVALVPALFAFADTVAPLSGRQALGALVVGYEVASRAGVALHASVADYHTSGAWNALGVGAMGARLRRLDATRLGWALGIAEYHGPRSQMMREIDHPSMLHDGSGWGALAGVSAVFLAEAGFVASPAATVSAPAAAAHWADLGAAWLTERQYVKPYPVCRWSHAAVDGVLRLRRAHDLDAADVARVEIATFDEAARLKAGMPESPAIAQYSLAFPVAAALVRGRLGVDEITGAALTDPEIERLVAATSVRTEDRHNVRFPDGRWGQVDLVLEDGRRLESGEIDARGGPDAPLSKDEMVAKFHAFAAPVLGAARAGAIEAAVLGLDAADAGFAGLVDLVAPPPAD